MLCHDSCHHAPFHLLWASFFKWLRERQRKVAQSIRKHQVNRTQDWDIQDLIITQVTKKVFWMKTSACRDETLKNQPNKTGTTQHIYIIPTPCTILPTMPQPKTLYTLTKWTQKDTHHMISFCNLIGGALSEPPLNPPMLPGSFVPHVERGNGPENEVTCNASAGPLQQ